ncbi:MAG: AMP-binding protein, partial [Candidatus Sifarchaeia archaeon]
MPEKEKLSYYSECSDIGLIGKTIGEYLAEITEKYPNNDALVCRHERDASGEILRYDYKEFYEVCRQAAKGFMKLGVQKGDRVAIWSTNNSQWVITQFATALIGAILVNINPAYRPRELRFALKQSETQTLLLIREFKTSKYVEMFYEVCPEAKTDDPGDIKSEEFPFLKTAIFIGKEKLPGMLIWDDLIAMGDEISDEELANREDGLEFDDPINIQYTSGTTGFPKGVTLSHHNILNNGYFIARAMKFTDQDRLCIPVPFYHCFGMVLGNLVCVSHGATMVIPGESFVVTEVLECIQEEKCTSLHGVPTMFIAELDHPDFDKYDLSSLRTGIMAGSPCPVEVMKKVNNLMNANEITIAYGQTETSPVITQTTPYDSLELRTETVGKPLPHVEVKIIDPETGKIVPVGIPGELCTRGYLVMRHGYYKSPEATNNALDEIDWIHTGDIATMNEQGYCNITGRLTDMIIRGGENIYPRELEEFLYRHPEVKDVQVIGVPSEKFGEEVAAWIQLKEGKEGTVTTEDIRAFCKDEIAYFKVPKYIKFVDSFPMTVTGKIQKYIMREQYTKELGLEEV